MVNGRKPEPATRKTEEGRRIVKVEPIRKKDKEKEKSHPMIVPADAVRQRRRVLFYRNRRKGLVGGFWKDGKKSHPRRVKKKK